MSEQGHNARQQLLSIVERIEALNGQIKEISSDRTDIFAEAKGAGYDIAALKIVIRHRREDKERLVEREANVEAYSLAIDNA